jgi:5'-nucleotidase
VIYALDRMGLHPDVVVSGINQGQNLGPIAGISGTLGAAKQAAEKGIPALAVSQGLGSPHDVAAQLAVRWVQAHANQLRTHRATVGVVNLNVPTCTSGSLRGVRDVPLATTADGALAPADCTFTVTAVSTDIQAFLNGFAAATQLSAQGTSVTRTTTFPATTPST